MKWVTIVSLCLNAAVLAFIALGKLEFNTKNPVPAVSCDQVCMDYHNSNYKLLNGQLLKTMANNYQHPNNNLIYRNTNFNFGAGYSGDTLRISKSNNIIIPDAHSVWFGLEDLKRFLWDIETKVCKNSCSNLNSSDLGVRIYYARYPDSSLFNHLSGGLKLQKEYEWLHTAFMVPTYNSPSNEHIDFLLDSTYSGKKCMPTPVPMADNAIFQVRVLLSQPSPDGKNHGDLCPPVCEGSAF